jgi:hypothetical protein
MGVSFGTQTTVTVAVMNGWNEQMYVYVPGASNVTLADIPGSIDPVSNVPELVAVCAWLSSLVHVTVPPTAIVTSAGPKAKSEITTAASMGASRAGAGTVAGGSADETVAAEAEASSLPHDAVATARRTAASGNRREGFTATDSTQRLVPDCRCDLDHSGLKQASDAARPTAESAVTHLG